ncbi:hypothetical protein MJO28_009177 [Puccinia striiformis f. sp. tritici]|uniref:Uncharacterized protein n=1 Tax=Puccinia striiformis f. sp. tritici TaxID=168172 RepID=A0ACC0E8B8_9BASI|nr:hypothetical protein MJO28_009177 [Puccinia striiformis f. sp. tritici]
MALPTINTTCAIPKTRKTQAAPNSVSAEARNVLKVCYAMDSVKLNPKKFMMAFLNQSNSLINLRRKLWGAPTGWDSTLDVVKAARNLICRKPAGREFWNSFILSEAQTIIEKEGCFRDAVAKGFYQSSNDIEPDYFDDTVKQSRNLLIQGSMPFLYKLVMSKLMGRSFKSADDLLNVDDEDNFSDSQTITDCDSDDDLGATESPSRMAKRCQSVATTICSMVSFICNRRRNGLQISNAVVMLACGVSERVSSYLHYIGLSSSRKTAHAALNSLSKCAQGAIKTTAQIGDTINFPAIICIDNIDFEEGVHSKSINRQSRMFHGTWGYMHRIDPTVLASVNREDLTLPRYKAAIAESAHMVIRPSLFLPTNKENIHFRTVLKTQIASVLLRYVATPDLPDIQIPIVPPVIDPINPVKPDITTLKLMLASDNSAEGIGEVFESITNQLNIEKSKFFGRLQVFEGDLGTCLNIESLRSQRKPSRHVEDSFENSFTLLGAAHILWNVAQTLLLFHFGDNTNANDLGAWHCMNSLGIPSKRPTAKNDFTLMLAHMHKVHEATILHCLLTVMNHPSLAFTHEKQVMPANDLLKIIDQCYEQFFSPGARRQALGLKSGKHYNLLMRLRDFSTVVECNAAMRAGDVGRLINIWRRWSIMAQGTPGLTNYAIYLPRMLLLLTKVLPEGLQKVLKHSLLISPSGRPNHFVAKDFYLEVQNYWLKFFYNRTGTGTNIIRMMDIFSINIPLLRRLVHDLKSDLGQANKYQSHNTTLSSIAIEEFLKMAHQYDLCSSENESTENITHTIDIFEKGFKKIRTTQLQTSEEMKH